MQFSRAKGVAAALANHLSPCQSAQLLIEEWRQPVERGRV